MGSFEFINRDTSKKQIDKAVSIKPKSTRQQPGKKKKKKAQQ
jgi:hypothetical protein